MADRIVVLAAPAKIKLELMIDRKNVDAQSLDAFARSDYRNARELT